MKAIMFIVMICGQPDMIMWHDSKGDFVMYWNEAQHNMEALKFMRNWAVLPDHKTVVVQDKRNICS